MKSALWPTRIGTVAIGAASLWAQVMVVRAGLVAFGGNELVVGLLFGFWLAAVGLGAFTGGALVGIVRRHTEVVLAGLLLTAAAVIYAEFFCARALRGIMGFPAGQCPQVWQITAGAALITCPVGVLVGLVFPFLAKARRARAEGAGEVYGLEAAGSLTAAFLGTYLFLAWGRDDLLAFAAIAVLLFGAYAFLRGLFLAKCLGALLLVWCFLGQYNLHVLKEWSNPYRWRGFMGEFRLEASAETPYGSLAVLARAGQYDLYLDGQLAFSFPTPLDEEIVAHVAATQAPQLESILVVGGQPGLVRELLKYKPRALQVVRFDPAVDALLDPHVEPETKKALAATPVRRIAADPRAFLRRLSAESCDLVLLALPEPSSAHLNRFYTVDFFREVKRVLRPEGVLTFSLEAAVQLQEEVSLYAATCLRALKEVFPDPVVTAGQTLRFFAAPRAGVVTTQGELLARRFAQRTIPTRTFLEFFFLEDESFRPFMVRRTAERLGERLREVEPERDSRPTLFMRHLIIFAQIAESSLEGVIRGLLSLSAWQLLPPALLAGVVVLLLGRWRVPPVVTAVVATGTWGMALEIVVLFTFQVVSGSLYHKVGMLAGAFMCGLSLGALRGRRIRRARRGLFVTEGAAVLGALLTPVVAAAASRLGGTGAELLLYGWVALVGAVTGFQFSVANRTLGGPSGARSNLIAALTDGGDHLGACAGALVTGLALLPSLGVVGTALFLAILKAGTLGGLAVGRGAWRRG